MRSHIKWMGENSQLYKSSEKGPGHIHSLSLIHILPEPLLLRPQRLYRRMKQHRQIEPHRQIFPKQSPLARSGKETALKGMEKPRRISREN